MRNPAAVFDRLTVLRIAKFRQVHNVVLLQNKIVVTVTPSGRIVDSCGNVLVLGSPAVAMHVTC